MESASLSVEIETRNIHFKFETEFETKTECKKFVKIYGLNTCIQWKLGIITSFMYDFIKKEQDSTDIPFNIMTVNMRDSKTKDVETETFRDWKFGEISRPRLFETRKFKGCRDRDRPRLRKSCRDRNFMESLANHWIIRKTTTD